MAAEGTPPRGGVTDAEYEKKVFCQLVQLTRVSNTLPPLGEEWAFSETFPSFRSAVDSVGTRIASLLQGVGQQRMPGALGTLPSGPTRHDDLFDAVVDMSDRFLEHVDLAHDAAARATAIGSPPHPLPHPAGAGASRDREAKLHQRPQSKWFRPEDNTVRIHGRRCPSTPAIESPAKPRVRPGRPFHPETAAQAQRHCAPGHSDEPRPGDRRKAI